MMLATAKTPHVVNCVEPLAQRDFAALACHIVHPLIFFNNA
jgi:hypothetical protein